MTSLLSSAWGSGAKVIMVIATCNEHDEPSSMFVSSYASWDKFNMDIIDQWFNVCWCCFDLWKIISDNIWEHWINPGKGLDFILIHVLVQHSQLTYARYAWQLIASTVTGILHVLVLFGTILPHYCTFINKLAWPKHTCVLNVKDLRAQSEIVAFV